MLGFILLTSAAASPLYAVYQAQWKFSAATLTAVFAIYAIFLLATLLLFGSVADYLGRRPVILAARALQGVALASSALHGGLWRAPYQPRSALGLAAILGYRAART